MELTRCAFFWETDFEGSRCFTIGRWNCTDPNGLVKTSLTITLSLYEANRLLRCLKRKPRLRKKGVEK